MNPVIAANEVSDGMNLNNVESRIITADHDLGELKLNAHQNDVDLFHHENDGERNNLSFDEQKEEKTLHQMKQNGARLLHGEW
jgi:hypothetical protein